MKIEYNPALPPQNRRFTCHKCQTIYIAEGEGQDWFIRNTPKYLPPVVISYCPVCGTENREDF